MYLEHFALSDQPFRLTPDCNYLYLSPVHAKAKAYMEFSILNRDSFVVISGEIGCGKTTLLQKVLSELDENVTVARIHQTQLAEVQFLQAMLKEFGIRAYQAGKVELLDRLNEFLVEQYESDRRVVLIVDEAQNLGPRVLEEIRLLSGLETNRDASLNVVLVGQPELRETLKAPEMEQLRQRIRLQYHVTPLSADETRKYVEHRLAVAGLEEGRELFAEETYPEIYLFTNGIPRMINTLCDTALTGACVEEAELVDLELLRQAIDELQWKPYSARRFAVIEEPAETGVPMKQMAKLILRERGEMIGEYLLHKQSMTIGRNPDNDIQINDSVVSSYHARIITTDDGSTVYDLNSTNGTYVNGKHTRKCPLRSGDTITITRYQLEYVQEADLNKPGSRTDQRRVLDSTLAMKAANESSD